MRWALPLLLALHACGAEPDPASARLAPPLVAPPSSAGSERCAACHAGHASDWSRTGMARALGPLVEGELRGLGAVEDGAGYRFELLEHPEHGPLLAETHRDHPGHAVASPVLFAIGAGELDRSYAALHGAGVRFAPVEAVPVPGGRRLALAPHAAMRPGSRLSLPITGECLGCHTDAPPPAAFPLDALPRDWKPRGIGCAACHGGAGGHADWQLADERGEAAGEDPLVALGDLERHERLSICAACHLQGDARLVLEPEALGPPPPGGDLLARRVLFVAREAGDEVGFVSQVERLVLSRCFLESAMTCESCHDPHRSLHEPEVRAEVRAACLRCHEPDAGARVGLGARPLASRCSRGVDTTIETHSVQLEPAVRRDCVDCHMPRTGVFDVAGVTVHDHFVRRRPGPPRPPSEDHELRYPESPEGDWRVFTWPGEPAPPHATDPGLWAMALAGAGHRERAREALARGAGEAAGRLPMFHHVRGSLLEEVGEDAEAVAAYRRALELTGGVPTPASAPAATNLGRLLGATGRSEEGLAVLDALLDRHPGADGALRNRAVLHAAAGRPAQAARDLEAAFALRPDAGLARALARMARGAGDAAAAARFEADARALDPLGSE